MSKRKKKTLQVTVLMYVQGDDTPCKVETTCEPRNVGFLWGSLTAQCEDVDSYAEEQRALGGEDDVEAGGKR